MKFTFIVFVYAFLILACENPPNKPSTEIKEEISVPEKLEPLVDSFLTFDLNGHLVDIAPKDSSVEFRGNVIIFQGYNFPKHDWCEKVPELCEKLSKSGYVLIMPEMGRSVFADSVYPETAEIFKKYPTRKWLRDSLIPLLQKKYQILLPEQKNLILGLSTGARGGALIALDYPELFSAAALLSGDYDQSRMPDDKLMTAFYGPYTADSSRWKTVDNIIFRIEDWKLPLYLGHGKNDVIVPPDQSRFLYDTLVSRGFKNVKINEPEMAHDYKYWGSETEAIIDFFNKQ